MSNITLNSQKKGLSFSWNMCLLFVVSAVVMAAPDLVFAGTDTPIGNIFCIVVDWFTGNTGKGIATIAITIIGIGALLGKVSWGMALIVGLGVAVVFGASGILNALNVSGVPTGCSTSATY